MCGLGDESVRVADELDSAGNTVKAITKGFAIGAAGLTRHQPSVRVHQRRIRAAEALGVAGIDMLAITDPTVFFGYRRSRDASRFLGDAYARRRRNAQRMVAEIKRQFSTIIGLRGAEKALSRITRAASQ